MTDKSKNDGKAVDIPSPDATFDSAETLVTPATGITREGEPSGLSTASLAGRDPKPTSTEQKLRFGRFVTESMIGKGGMGVVFKAVDPLIGRTVAIKALRTDTGMIGDSQDELQSRFELEFKSAGTLSHANIVTIYDVGQENNTTFIAMEFIDGRSLEQLLREGDVLSFERIGEVVQGICWGLDYAHAANIVHRDIKPANILIEPGSGIPKITDFGVAKVQSSGLTQTGTVIGTPAYMSPEQILGKEVSGRSDQFSAAVILYQMLTGKLPFGSDAPASILFRIVHNDPEPPHELNPDVPEALSNVVAKALAKDPADRFESCADMAAAANRALLGQEPRPEDDSVDASSFKSVTLSTTEPLRGSGTYAGAASWWQRQHAAPRLGLGLLGALLFAAIGWVAVANFMERDAVPAGFFPFEVPPFLQAESSARAAEEAARQVANQPGPNEPNASTTGAPGTGPALVAGSAEAPSTAPVPRVYTIDSKPQGATVQLAGKQLEGTTPLAVKLNIGETYEVTVSLAGYRSAGSQVTADADGNASPFYTLAPDIKPGRITFNKPEGYGSLIFESAGRRLDPSSISPGVHNITIKAPDNYMVIGPSEYKVLEGKALNIELPALQEISVIGIGGGTNTVSIDGGPQRALQIPSLWVQPRTAHRFAFTFDDGRKRERLLMIGSQVKRVVGSVDEIAAQNR